MKYHRWKAQPEHHRWVCTHDPFYRGKGCNGCGLMVNCAELLRVHTPRLNLDRIVAERGEAR